MRNAIQTLRTRLGRALHGEPYNPWHRVELVKAVTPGLGEHVPVGTQGQIRETWTNGHVMTTWDNGARCTFNPSNGDEVRIIGTNFAPSA